MSRHVFPCKDPDCDYCEDFAEEHAQRVAEAHADDLADAEDRYEREVLGL